MKTVQIKTPFFKDILRHLDFFFLFHFSSVESRCPWNRYDIFLPALLYLDLLGLNSSCFFSVNLMPPLLFYGLLVKVLCFTFNLVGFPYLTNLCHKALLNTGRIPCLGESAVSVSAASLELCLLPFLQLPVSRSRQEHSLLLHSRS